MSMCLFSSDISNAFPENVRLGYTSCSSCHIDPHGAGVLTPYGRATSSEISTWSSEEESAWPQWLLAGGQIRHVRTHEKEISRSILMQTEGTVGFTTKKFDGVLTYGSYHNQKRVREFYGTYRLGTLTFRIGKFLQAYGLRVDDHTLWTRRSLGFDQNTELYGWDLTHTAKDAEFTFGAINHIESAISQDVDQQIVGLSGKASFFLGTSALVGASYLYKSSNDQVTSMVGPHVIVGYTKKLYQMAEIHKTWPLKKTFVYHKFGYEVYKGVHTYMAQSISHGDNRAYRFDYGTRWLPYKYVDLLIEVSALSTGGGGQLEGPFVHPIKLVSHLYF